MPQKARLYMFVHEALIEQAELELKISFF